MPEWLEIGGTMLLIGAMAGAAVIVSGGIVLFAFSRRLGGRSSRQSEAGEGEADAKAQGVVVDIYRAPMTGEIKVDVRFGSFGPVELAIPVDEMERVPEPTRQ